MDVLIPILIYVVTPIIGIALYLYLVAKLKPSESKQVFIFKLFFTFSIFGGLLLLLLTTLFWKWSGLATIGVIGLVFVAPAIMLVIAFDSYKKYDETCEKILFKVSCSYFILLPLVFLISYLLDK